MGLSGVQQFLWAGCFAANCVLLAVLLIRKRAASFPAFTFLIAFSIAKTIVLFSTALRFGIQSTPYADAFWSLGYGYDMLQLVVFYELAKHVFCPTGTWARDTRRAFQWLIAASVLLALGLSLLAAPSSTARWYRTYQLRGDFFVSMLMSELFVGMMVLAASAGLPWKTHVARIAQGFGISAVLSLALDGANNYFGVGTGHHMFKLIGNVGRFSTLGFIGFWIVTLWQEAPAPRELPEAMLMQIYTLQRRVENDLGRIRNWRRI